MPDQPILSDSTKRKLELQLETVREKQKLTEQELTNHDKERQRLLQMPAKPPSHVRPLRPHWAAREVGLIQSVRAAEARFRGIDSEYWSHWCSSGLGYEVYRDWVDFLKQQVPTELASIWKGRSVVTDRWFDSTCAPALEKALAVLMKQRIAQARDVETKRLERSSSKVGKANGKPVADAILARANDPGSTRLLIQSDDACPSHPIEIVLPDPAPYASDAITAIDAQLTATFEQIAQAAGAMDLAIAPVTLPSVPIIRFGTHSRDDPQHTSAPSTEPNTTSSLAITASPSLPPESKQVNKTILPKVEANAPKQPSLSEATAPRWSIVTGLGELRKYKIMRERFEQLIREALAELHFRFDFSFEAVDTWLDFLLKVSPNSKGSAISDLGAASKHELGELKVIARESGNPALFANLRNLENRCEFPKSLHAILRGDLCGVPPDIRGEAGRPPISEPQRSTAIRGRITSGGRPRALVIVGEKVIDLRGDTSQKTLARLTRLSIDVIQRAEQGKATERTIRKLTKFAKSKGIELSPDSLKKNPPPKTAKR